MLLLLPGSKVQRDSDIFSQSMRLKDYLGARIRSRGARASERDEAKRVLMCQREALERQSSEADGGHLSKCDFRHITTLLVSLPLSSRD